MYRFPIIFIFVYLAFGVHAQKLPESYFRGQAAIDNGAYELAIQWLDSAHNNNPRNPSILVKQGEAFFRTGNYTNALEAFQNASKIREGIATYWMARTYAMLLDTANVFLELEKHLSSSPKESEPSIQIDTAFSRYRETTHWKSIWLKSWYSNNETLIADVEYHFSRCEWNQALDLLNERMDGRSANHRLFALRGEAYFNIGSFKAAEEDFAYALKRSRRNYSYMAMRAKAQIKLEQHRKAIDLLNKSIELSGGDPKYFSLRSQAFAGNQQFTEAINDIKYFLTFYPNWINGIALLASYAYDGGKEIEALMQLGKLIKIQPKNAEHYLKRAKIYIKTGNWEVAEMDLTQAIALSQSIAEAFLNRGVCRINMGKKLDACSDWNIAVKLGNFQAQELVYKHCRK